MMVLLTITGEVDRGHMSYYVTNLSLGKYLAENLENEKICQMLKKA